MNSVPLISFSEFHIWIFDACLVYSTRLQLKFLLASSGCGNAFRGGYATSILLLGSLLTFHEFSAIDILFRIYRSLVIGIFGACLVQQIVNHNVKDLNYKTCWHLQWNNLVQRWRKILLSTEYIAETWRTCSRRWGLSSGSTSAPTSRTWSWRRRNWSTTSFLSSGTTAKTVMDLTFRWGGRGETQNKFTFPSC